MCAASTANKRGGGGSSDSAAVVAGGVDAVVAEAGDPVGDVVLGGSLVGSF